MRCEIERGFLDTRAGNKDSRFGREMHLPGERTIGTKPEILRPPVLLDELQAPALPGAKCRDSQSFPDDLVDFCPDEELVHVELFLGIQLRDRLITNFQQRGPRDREFVILDLILDV